MGRNVSDPLNSRSTLIDELIESMTTNAQHTQRSEEHGRKQKQSQDSVVHKTYEPVWQQVAEMTTSRFPNEAAQTLKLPKKQTIHYATYIYKPRIKYSSIFDTDRSRYFSKPIMLNSDLESEKYSNIA